MSVRELRELGRLLDAGSEERTEQVVRRTVRAAERDDLVDVGYAFADGPLGRLLVAVTLRGVVRVSYLATEDADQVLERLAATVSPRVLESDRLTSEARRELDQYLAGERRTFDVPVDLHGVRGFGLRVLEVTAAIPFGQVAWYSQVAARAGSPRAARATGNALGANPVPIIVPCHRVLPATGGVGGYAGRPERKVALLRLEGSLPAEPPV
jgi:methylated-DNA-[protein]-cysteine S-methyltransferase